MKLIILIISIFATGSLYGQTKSSYLHFNKLTEIRGSAYIFAQTEERGKGMSTHQKHLLFINTQSGETRQVDFPKEAYIEEVKQVKIDSLGINCLIVFARTGSFNEKKGISRSDPKQVMVLSTDGKEKVQLTEDSFFSRSWAVNQQTGRLVIVGHHDSNGNHKYDKKDKEGILIYDLKTLRLVTGNNASVADTE